jgi:DNA-binding protein H-NS
MSTLQELMHQREALERQIAAAQAEARRDAITKVRELMATYGLSVADLSGSMRKRESGSFSRAKVAPKFINKATGETWSGRGLKPRWLANAIASGAKLEDFAV